MNDNLEGGSKVKREELERREAFVSRGCLRGIRLRKGLPVNGGRTQSNGKTAKKLNGGRVRSFVKKS